jgi:hypothetical protein
VAERAAAVHYYRRHVQLRQDAGNAVYGADVGRKRPVLERDHRAAQLYQGKFLQ